MSEVSECVGACVFGHDGRGDDGTQWKQMGVPLKTDRIDRQEEFLYLHFDL